MRALDIEASRTVCNEQRVVDFVTQFVVEIGIVVEVCGVDAAPVGDVEHAVGLTDRSGRQQVGETHT